MTQKSIFKGFSFTFCLLTLFVLSGAASTSSLLGDSQPPYSVEQAPVKGQMGSLTKKSGKSIAQQETSPAELAQEPLDENPQQESNKTDQVPSQVVPFPPIEEETVDAADEEPDLDTSLTDDRWPGWITNYRKGYEEAKEQEKMLLVYFYDTNDTSPYTAFETESLADEDVQTLLENYVCVRIPATGTLSPLKEKTEQKADSQEPLDAEAATDAKTETSQRHTVRRPDIEKFKLIAPGRDMGSVAQLKTQKYDLGFANLDEKIMLIKHPAFYEMLNTPGVAIIDFQNKDAEYYGCVVSVFPFLKKKPYTIEETRTMLSLPPGTVTQRSLIFAVRIHPDNPKSSDGELYPRLIEEAGSHSQYQANIRKQGHHHWNRRFQEINRELPTELLAVEVCAESWPGQHLLESAIECVACWRFSEGHWSAVVAEHPYYGYDMKLGTNGVWYGTGVFGKWRHPFLPKSTQFTKPQVLPRSNR